MQNSDISSSMTRLEKNSKIRQRSCLRSVGYGAPVLLQYTYDFRTGVECQGPAATDVTLVVENANDKILASKHP